MKIKSIQNPIEGIMTVECEGYDEARALIKALKTKYPFAIMNGNGCYSKEFNLNLYETWGDAVEVKMAEDGEITTCINCGECEGNHIKPHRKSSPGIISDPERCFMEQFWAEVVQERCRHFIDENNNVYAIVSADKGGFYGSVYDIFFEDGDKLIKIGLWHRGKAPKSVRHLFRKGIREISRRS